MIEIRQLTKSFDNHKSLNDVTVEFKEGEKVALMGANGAGKTTLVRSILGHYIPDSGEVLINGINPAKNRVEVLKHISFVPQLPPPIKLNVSELLEYIMASTNTTLEKIEYFAKAMEVNLDEYYKKSFYKLSGGMKQKLLIVISLANDGNVSIYDEPTANLDPKARDNFHTLLEDHSSGKTILFITHRLQEVQGIVNRQVYMDLGKIINDEKVNNE